MAFAKEELKNYVDRIIALEQQKQGIADDIKEVKAEAKGAGFDTKVLNKIVDLVQTDRSIIMETDSIEDLYRRAVGLPPLKD